MNLNSVGHLHPMPYLSPDQALLSCLPSSSCETCEAFAFEVMGVGQGSKLWWKCMYSKRYDRA